MANKQRMLAIVVIMVILMGLFSGCETVLAILETPFYPEYFPDAKGIATITSPEQIFTVRIADPLILEIPVVKTGMYEFVNLSHPDILLYMGLFSKDVDKKDPLGGNLVDGKPIDRITAQLQEGTSYLVGIGTLMENLIGRYTIFQLREVTGPKNIEPVLIKPVTVEKPQTATVEPLQKPGELPLLRTSDIFTIEEPAMPVSMARTLPPFIDNPGIPEKNTLTGALSGVFTKEGSPYLLTGISTIEKDTVLTIEAGTIIRMAPQASIQVKGLLASMGTAGNEVVFTGDNSTMAGSWGGIVLFPESKATLQSTRIIGAGNQTIVENTWREGSIIALSESQPTLIDCEISQGKGPGIALYGTVESVIKDSSFENLEKAIQINKATSTNLIMSGNHFGSLSQQGIEITDSVLPAGTELSLQAQTIPYIFGNYTIEEGAKLTIYGQNILKFHPGTGLTVEGTLDVSGTTSGGVFFTSIIDDRGYDSNGDTDASKPKPGDWQGILFTKKGTGNLRGASILYAGGQRIADSNWRAGALMVGGSADPFLEGCIIAHSNENAVTLYETANPTIQGSILRDAKYPILIQDVRSLGFTLQQNSYQNMQYMGSLLQDHTVQSGQSIFIKGNDSLPYILEMLTVESGATLTVLDDTLLKFRYGGQLIVYGNIVSKPNLENSVMFTSDSNNYNGDSNGDGADGKPKKGDWGGIVFGSDATGTFQATTISYAGAQKVVEGTWREGAVTIGGTAKVSFFLSSIQSSMTCAFTFQNQGTMSCEQVTIGDTDWVGIIKDPRSVPSSMNVMQYEDSVVHKALKLEFNEIPGGVQAEIRGDLIAGLTFVGSNLYIPSTASLTLSSVILKMEQGTQISVDGNFTVLDSPGFPSIITSIKDDVHGDTNGDGNQSNPQPGDWIGIVYMGSAGGTLDFERLDWAGAQAVVSGTWRSGALIATGNATPIIRRLEINHSNGDGLLVIEKANPSLGTLQVLNQKGIPINR